jgi:hypothetical protein
MFEQPAQLRPIGWTMPPHAATAAQPESKDGVGAADHDQPYGGCLATCSRPDNSSGSCCCVVKSLRLGWATAICQRSAQGIGQLGSQRRPVR